MLEKDKAKLLSTWRHYVEKTANTGKRVMGFGEWMEEVYFVVTPTLSIDLNESEIHVIRLAIIDCLKFDEAAYRKPTREILKSLRNRFTELASTPVETCSLD